MRLSLVVALAGSCVLGACGSSDADFAVRYAPDFRREGTAVSVFGVYKDGRMSADAWNDLGPRFAGALGGTCEAAYRDDLVATDRALSDAIDDQTREGGVPDELLDVFAPAASGDALLLVTMSGQLPHALPTGKGGGKAPPPTSSPPPSGRGGRRGMRGGPEAEATGKRYSKDVLELSASVFSARDHRTVAVVAMTYTGKSTEEALALFSEKLRAELPKTHCAGWKRDVKVDAERVRAVRPAE